MQAILGFAPRGCQVKRYFDERQRELCKKKRKIRNIPLLHSVLSRMDSSLTFVYKWLFEIQVALSQKTWWCLLRKQRKNYFRAEFRRVNTWWTSVFHKLLFMVSPTEVAWQLERLSRKLTNHSFYQRPWAKQQIISFTFFFKISLQGIKKWTFYI